MTPTFNHIGLSGKVSIRFVTTDATCITFLDSNAQLPNITPFTQSGNSNRQCVSVSPDDVTL